MYETIGNLKNTLHVTWRVPGRARSTARGFEGENSWPNLRIVYFCQGHYADDPRVLGQIRDICYRATFGTRASSARLNREPNIYDAVVFIIVGVTRFRELRKPRPGHRVSPRVTLIHGIPLVDRASCELIAGRVSMISTTLWFERGCVNIITLG